MKHYLCSELSSFNDNFEDSNVELFLRKIISSENCFLSFKRMEVPFLQQFGSLCNILSSLKAKNRQALGDPTYIFWLLYRWSYTLIELGSKEATIVINVLSRHQLLPGLCVHASSKRGNLLRYLVSSLETALQEDESCCDNLESCWLIRFILTIPNLLEKCFDEILENISIKISQQLSRIRNDSDSSSTTDFDDETHKSLRFFVVLIHSSHKSTKTFVLVTNQFISRCIKFVENISIPAIGIRSSETIMQQGHVCVLQELCVRIQLVVLLTIMHYVDGVRSPSTHGRSSHAISIETIDTLGKAFSKSLDELASIDTEGSRFLSLFLTLTALLPPSFSTSDKNGRHVDLKAYCLDELRLRHLHKSLYPYSFQGFPSRRPATATASSFSSSDDKYKSVVRQVLISSRHAPHSIDASSFAAGDWLSCLRVVLRGTLSSGPSRGLLLALAADTEIRSSLIACIERAKAPLHPRLLETLELWAVCCVQSSCSRVGPPISLSEAKYLCSQRGCALPSTDSTVKESVAGVLAVYSAMTYVVQYRRWSSEAFPEAVSSQSPLVVPFAPDFRELPVALCIRKLEYLLKFCGDLDNQVTQLRFNFMCYVEELVPEVLWVGDASLLCCVNLEEIRNEQVLVNPPTEGSISNTFENLLAKVSLGSCSAEVSSAGFLAQRLVISQAVAFGDARRLVLHTLSTYLRINSSDDDVARGRAGQKHQTSVSSDVNHRLRQDRLFAIWRLCRLKDEIPQMFEVDTMRAFLEGCGVALTPVSSYSALEREPFILFRYPMTLWKEPIVWKILSHIALPLLDSATNAIIRSRHEEMQQKELSVAITLVLWITISLSVWNEISLTSHEVPNHSSCYDQADGIRNIVKTLISQTLAQDTFQYSTVVSGTAFRKNLQYSLRRLLSKPGLYEGFVNQFMDVLKGEGPDAKGSAQDCLSPFRGIFVTALSNQFDSTSDFVEWVQSSCIQLSRYHLRELLETALHSLQYGKQMDTSPNVASPLQMPQCERNLFCWNCGFCSDAYVQPKQAAKHLEESESGNGVKRFRTVLLRPGDASSRPRKVIEWFRVQGPSNREKRKRKRPSG